MYLSDHQTHWDRHIPLNLLAYRSSIHETTGQISTSIVFRKYLRLPADVRENQINRQEQKLICGNCETSYNQRARFGEFDESRYSLDGRSHTSQG